jgi:hypothetical protein
MFASVGRDIDGGEVAAAGSARDDGRLLLLLLALAFDTVVPTCRTVFPNVARDYTAVSLDALQVHERPRQGTRTSPWIALMS